MKSAITTHVLDTANGVPARGIKVTLDILIAETWKTVGVEYYH
jgi:5-hydroxyisourate hydrolase-like protein (transthyretin family)